MTKILEQERAHWAKVAKKHGWYTEPFYVQIWIYKDGTLDDSVSFRGMTQDIIINMVYNQTKINKSSVIPTY